MGQYGFDRACFSVVFLFLLCFIDHLYEANGGTDMEVFACFRPGFCFIVLAFTEKNGFVTATKLGTTNKLLVAATKNIAAVTKRFVDRTKHFAVVTKYFCYPCF